MKDREIRVVYNKFHRTKIKIKIDKNECIEVNISIFTKVGSSSGTFSIQIELRYMMLFLDRKLGIQYHS